MHPKGNDLDFPCYLGYTSPRNYLLSRLEKVVGKRQRRQSVACGILHTSLSALPLYYARMKLRFVGIVDALYSRNFDREGVGLIRILRRITHG